MVFGVPKDRMFFAPRSEGGVGQNFASRWDKATFLYLSHSAVFSPDNRTTLCRAGEKEGDESDPPKKWGGM